VLKFFQLCHYHHLS